MAKNIKKLEREKQQNSNRVSVKGQILIVALAVTVILLMAWFSKHAPLK
jgi:hypothetical protein